VVITDNKHNALLEADAEFIVPTGTFFSAQRHVLIPHYGRASPKSEDELEKGPTPPGAFKVAEM
jgi:hypothetical protein